MNILNKIENYKKEKLTEINKILDFKKDYKIIFNKNDNTIINIEYNNKIILTGTFNFFGIYNNEKKLWIWASSIPGITKKQIKQINKLKEFDYLFESIDNEKSNFYYQLLTQDVIEILDINKLEWINDLLIYLSNNKYYFNPINSVNNIQFITLNKIIEKYV